VYGATAIQDREPLSECVQTDARDRHERQQVGTVQRDVVEPVAIMLPARRVRARAAVGKRSPIIKDGRAGLGQLCPDGLVLGGPRREGQIMPFGRMAGRHGNFARLRSTMRSKRRSDAAVSVPA
jgi:hypothetical protein